MRRVRELANAGIVLGDLAAQVRLDSPEVVGACLVGSAVTMQMDLVRDIDVTAFSYEQPLEKERLVSRPWSGRRLDVVIYNASYFRTICLDPQLFLLNLREARKLIDGIVLFDERDELASAKREIERTEIPLDLLRPLLAAAKVPSALGGATIDKLAFLQCFDRFSFVLLHSKKEFRYRKAKWRLHDLRESGVDTAIDCANLLASEQHKLAPRGVAAKRLRDLVSKSELLSKQVDLVAMLEDAELLAAKGLSLEAEFPLRHAATQLAKAGTEGSSGNALEVVVEGLRQTAKANPDLHEALVEALGLKRKVSQELLASYSKAFEDLCRSMRISGAAEAAVHYVESQSKR